MIFGTKDALEKNIDLEFERNNERYEFLKWAENSFENYRAVPPATGIIHQVNIEFLSDVIINKDGLLYPDSMFGTDSHTTMINGIGVLGWGVGGIEAEAAMLGEASYFPIPEVIGVRLAGQLPKVATATDLALKVTQLLRQENVVGKFVEFFGPGLSSLTLGSSNCFQYGSRIRCDLWLFPDRWRNFTLYEIDQPFGGARGVDRSLC